MFSFSLTQKSDFFYAAGYTAGLFIGILIAIIFFLAVIGVIVTAIRVALNAPKYTLSGQPLNKAAFLAMAKQQAQQQRFQAQAEAYAKQVSVARSRTHLADNKPEDAK